MRKVFSRYSRMRTYASAPVSTSQLVTMRKNPRSTCSRNCMPASGGATAGMNVMPFRLLTATFSMSADDTASKKLARILSSGNTDDTSMLWNWK